MRSDNSPAKPRIWHITAADLATVLSDVGSAPDLTGEVVRRVNCKLTRFGRFIGLPEDKIEDTIQTTWLRIIAYRRPWSTYRNVDAWVLAIFVNHTRNVIRMRTSSRPLEERLPSPKCTPERLLLNREQRSNALRAWYALSPIDRDLLRGAASGRRIASATAARVGLSPDRARHRLMDARRRLWRALYPDAQPPQLRREKKFFGRR